MYATHRNQGSSGSKAFQSKSGTKATTKTTQRSDKSSKKESVATAQHVDRSAPAAAPAAAPQQSHQVRNATFASDSDSEVAEAGEVTAADDRKKIFLTRREQRELDRATFRRMENMVRFVDADNDVQTAVETPTQWVKCSMAEFQRYEAEYRRYERACLEDNEEPVKQDFRPIFSKAESRRHQRAHAFENKEETVQRDNSDIRPMATARDMKTKKRLAWDASDKQRTVEKRQDRS